LKSRASAEKFPEGGGATEKTRPKNSTIKLFSTLSVPCNMKIQEGYLKIHREKTLGICREYENPGEYHAPRCRRPCLNLTGAKTDTRILNFFLLLMLYSSAFSPKTN